MRVGGNEVERAGQGGESGLNGVEKDGVGEALRIAGGAIGGGCDSFLEERPGETERS